MSNNLCRCGGGRAHHENDFACWCPRCLSQPKEKRCTQLAPHIPVKLPPPPANQPQPNTLTPTQIRSADTPLANNSSSASLALAHISGTGEHGATAGEIATYLGLSGQAAVAALKHLAKRDDIVSRESPRKIGAAVEEVWVAVDPDIGAQPRQTTLWA